MNSRITAWLLISTALVLLAVAGQLEVIVIAAPAALLFSWLATHSRAVRQRKMLSEK
jgi:hypothetical protein